jgi:hypothetical protein
MIIGRGKGKWTIYFEGSLFGQAPPLRRAVGPARTRNYSSRLDDDFMANEALRASFPAHDPGSRKKRVIGSLTRPFIATHYATFFKELAMLRPNLGTGIFLLIAISFAGCASQPVADIQITGTPGAPITGYYVQNGQRVPLSSPMPLTIEKPGIQVIAVRKVNKDDSLHMEVRIAHPGGGSNPTAMISASPSGRAEGVRFVLQGGFYTSVILPGESLDAPQDSRLVINPYWYEGTWVFDDARFGLTREALVRGMPEMIDALVKDIPTAKQGFSLTFSERSFPGYQKKITWFKKQDGGNIYRLDDPPLQGWLCPEIFRYFNKTPKQLFVRVDPK